MFLFTSYKRSYNKRDRYFDHLYENRAVLVVLFVQKMVRLSWSMLTRPDNPVLISSYRSLSTKKNPLSV
ncbi:hypothetical protein RIR_jg25816.t1 [Rhizophagus irregularis DAOM 181602=DAOM 197198]|nr:hypothetical protein RIR_jg25816.t1 [Rhizophagus irregularis DAOM 181602=DAOM 197198]